MKKHSPNQSNKGHASIILNILCLTIFFNHHSVQAYLLNHEIDALSEFYDDLGGEEWSQCKWNITQLSLNNTLPSDYCGLYIEPLTSTDDDIQTITEINFKFDNNLNGVITPNIDKLTNLELIQIFYNELLNGDIPDSICNLTYLRVLSFQFANLSGSVPKCIGNISSLEWLLLSESPLLSLNDTIINLLCKNAKNMNGLQLLSINYFGVIPECIGHEWSELEIIVFLNLPNLNSTIPESFNNLTQITELELDHLPNLYGTFPSDLIKNNDLYYLEIYNTSLHGNISFDDNLCNKTNLNYLQIAYNPFLSSFTIPNCIDSMNNLQFLGIGSSSLIHGTIPPQICYLENLISLAISETSITGSVPQCITTNLTKLIVMDLHSNNLHGPFPSISSSQLKLFDIHNNSFGGSISSIFSSLDKYPNLEILSLHNNKFYDENIGIFIKKIFKFSSNLQAVTMYDQNFIGGKFPDFSDDDIYLNKLVVFAAHELNIGGVISSNIYFSDDNMTESIVSLYDNQFSSKIPSKLYRNSNVTPIILRGNLFSIYSDNDIPEWMANSQFIDATQLYLTLDDDVINWMVLIIAFVSFIFIVIKKKYQFIQHSDDEYLSDMKKIDEYLTDKKVLLMLLCLVIFYPFSSKYYSSYPITSYFALYFDSNDNVFMMILMVIFVIIYNVITINMTTQIIKKTFSENEKVQNVYYLNTKSIQLQNIKQSLIIHSSDDNKEHNDENEKFVYSLLLFLFYLFL
jgi:hypothetical protein